MANDFSPIEIDKIATIVKDYLKEGNGSISTRWAINKHFGDHQNGTVRRPDENEKVAAKICEDEKYIKWSSYSENDGYWMAKNPEKIGFWKSHPRIEKFLWMVVAAAIPIIIGICLQRSNKLSQQQVDIKQDSTIREVLNSQKIFQSHLVDTSKHWR